MLARLSVLLGKISPTLGELWGVQLGIFVLVSLLTGLFLAGYLVQGSRVGIQLWLALHRINGLARKGGHVDPDAIAAVLPQGPLRVLWEEYGDTLHRVAPAADAPAARAAAAAAVAEVRATVPAEMFFTREALVDGRLFDDFTRHLPGVLTGLGIIGTFAGLLEGLSRFDATSGATAVAGLKSLLDGVAHAFTTSAFAIGCAMLIVFVSKLALAIFYHQVESLNRLVDALYATGAGEEYLSRLVQSSEKSVTHAASLKKELVEEFSRLLITLSDRQMAAHAQHARAIGQYVTEALRAGLPSRRSPETPERPARGLGEPQSQHAPSGDLQRLAATLAELEAPIARLQQATGLLAGAVREIQTVLEHGRRG